MTVRHKRIGLSSHSSSLRSRLFDMHRGRRLPRNPKTLGRFQRFQFEPLEDRTFLAVTFTTNITINEGDTTYDGEDIIIDGATVEINGAHGFDSLQIVNGGILAHSPSTFTQTHKLDLTLAGEISVDATSRIDVSGKGYLRGRGPGNLTSTGATGESGGSHGGWGGNFRGTANAAYGDYRNPNDLGSGSAIGNVFGGPDSAAGGGLIRIAAGLVSLSGQVRADGINGGSGGGIYIATTTLEGPGVIQAAGGDAAYLNHGAGGGGRIAIYAADFSSFDTTRISATGGITNASATGTGTGTIYLRDTDEAFGALIVRGATGGGGGTPLTSVGDAETVIGDHLIVEGSKASARVWAPITFREDVTVRDDGWAIIAAPSALDGSLIANGGGKFRAEQDLQLDGDLQLTSGSTVEIVTAMFATNPLIVSGGSLVGGRIVAPELALQNGGLLTSFTATTNATSKLELEVTGELRIDATSRIDVSGKGYLRGRGPGNLTSTGATGESGGSHGGRGGNWIGVTNATYGDPSDPEDPGSGSAIGDVFGGPASAAGGGVLRIIAGELVVGGSLYADGINGGAGGSISIDAAKLDGSGDIRAAGGNAAYMNHGAGGGGRIAVYARDIANFNITRITTPGGNTNKPAQGQVGTTHVVAGHRLTHVRSHDPRGLNSGRIASPVAYVDIATNRALNTSSLVENLRITGQENNISASQVEIIGDRLHRVHFSRNLSENGIYHLEIPATTLDAFGFLLDQNANGVPGEADDGYSFTLIVDTKAPRIVRHEPAADVAGTIGFVDVWFSEVIDKTTFTTGDIAIRRPDGAQIAATSIEEVGFNRFRINFAPQTLVGQYEIKIGPDVRDLAHNKLDQDRDGAFGEAQDDVYTAGFNLVQVDLELSNLVVAPTQLIAGEPVLISWSGRNATGAALVGSWVDAVYLSSDDRWDINDTLLTTIPYSGGLAENDVYLASANVVVPGKLPGNYHILVRADIANQERETNEADNLIASAALPVTVNSLPADGVAVNGSLTAADRGDYYAITVAGGDGLEIVLDGLAASGANELYVRRDAIPTRQDFDARSIKGEFDASGIDHWIAVTAPEESAAYYVLVYGEQLATSSPYAISAHSAPVLVSDISPRRHGNAQAATIMLSGAGFDDSTVVEFIGSDDVIRSATNIRLVSSESMRLELDLPSWLVGEYRVRVVEENGTDELPAPFVVTLGGAGRLETNLILPSAVGYNIPIRQTIWIEYRNVGEIAIPAPLLELEGDSGARLTTDPSIAPQRGFGPIAGTSSSVQFLGLGGSSVPWLLQPGESRRTPVYYLGLSQPGNYPRVSFSLGTLQHSDERQISWTAFEQHIRPASLSDHEWALLTVSLEHVVGSTWGRYVKSLSQSVASLYETTGHTPSLQEAWSHLLQSALPPPVTLAAIDPVSLYYDGLNAYIQTFYSDVQQLSEHDPCNDLHNSLFASLKQIEQAKNDLADLTPGIVALEFTFAALDLASLFNAISIVRRAALELPRAARIVIAADELRDNGQNIVDAANRLGSSSSQPGAENSLSDIAQATSSVKSVFNFIMIEIANLSDLTIYGAYWDLINAVIDGEQIVSNVTFSATRSHLQQLWSTKVAFDNALEAYVEAVADPEPNPVIIELPPQVSGPSLVVGTVNVPLSSQFFAFDPDPDCQNLQPLQVGTEMAPATSVVTVFQYVLPGISQAQGSFEWTPSETGDFPVKIRVSDTQGKSFLYEFVVRVKDKEDPPDPPFEPGPGGAPPGVGSFDPNDKLSPAGYGETAFVQADGSLDYTIRFENMSDATAPARLISVVDTLDPNVDLDTFELTEIMFAGQTLTIPAGLKRYEAMVPITVGAGTPLVARVLAEVDRTTRELSLTLEGLDPETGWFSEDPLVGLLFPNDDTRRGEGSISYRVRPAAGLPTGTVIENRARIVFDFNDPIDTPLVFNTLDAGAPAASVLPLDAVTTTSSFTVSWAGEDDPGGSGIAGYDVFVSVDGAAYGLWLSGTPDTSATMIGEDGRTYAFYALATDNVGHRQPTPLAAQAITTIDLPEPIVSTVDRLPAVQNFRSFTVSWSAQTGGGPPAATFDVYVSEDGGPFTLWLDDTTQTSDVYVGSFKPAPQPRTYAFYSVATDAEGVEEIDLGSVEATTTIIDPATVVFVGGQVIVTGGPDYDVVRFVPGITAGSVLVRVNSRTYGPYGSPSKLIAFGNGGDDRMIIDRTAPMPPGELHGGDGEDRLLGGTGADVLYGDAGRDALDGGPGHDRIFGGDGDDQLNGARGDDVLYGEAGNDRLRGYLGHDLLFGGAGRDYLNGDDGNNVLVGGEANDRLGAEGGRNLMIGGVGRDIALGGSGGSILISGSTVHDESEEALLAILAEWSSDRTLTERVARITAGVSVGGHMLTFNGTVQNDDNWSVLEGGDGADWFFRYRKDLLLSFDALVDEITD